jgi:hypothetical protein
MSFAEEWLALIQLSGIFSCRNICLRVLIMLNNKIVLWFLTCDYLPYLPEFEGFFSSALDLNN